LHERGAFDPRTKDLATLVVMLKQKLADVKKERVKAEARVKEKEAPNAMKAMKLCNTASGKFERLKVFRGGEEKTCSGLKKVDLTKNKTGRIVSSRVSASSKIKYASTLGKWTLALMKAREALGIKGFLVVTKGSAYYEKAQEFYKQSQILNQAQAMERTMKVTKVMKGTDVMKAKKEPSKAMKVMKVSKIGTGKYARLRVFRGYTEKTSGGLKKVDLTRNRIGRIVSTRTSARSKVNYASTLAKWTQALMKAREALGIKGFVVVTKGSAVYEKAQEFYKQLQTLEQAPGSALSAMEIVSLASKLKNLTDTNTKPVPAEDD